MKKLTILCDVDGVIVDLLPEWLRAYQDAGGESIHSSDIKEYGWENYVKDRQLFLRLLKSGGIFASAKPLWGAIYGLAMLRQQHDLTLVTTVYGSRAMDNRVGWLFRYVQPMIKTHEIIFTAKKHLVRGDVLIEDSPANLDAWLAANPQSRAFIVDQPYNKKYVHPRCTRVESLLEVAFNLESENNDNR